MASLSEGLNPQVAAGSLPFVILIEQDCADWLGDRNLVCEEFDEICASLDFFFAAVQVGWYRYDDSRDDFLPRLSE